MLNAMFFRFVSLLAILGLLVGCGDEDGNVDAANSGSIQVSPFSVAFSQVNLGDTARQAVIITNVSPTQSLRLLEVKLEEVDGSTISDLKLVGLPSSYPFEIEAGGNHTFHVEYSPTSDTANQGRIRILSTDHRYTREAPLFVNVSTLPSRPQIDVSPPTVRFARMPPGNQNRQTLTIRNVGSAPLTLHEAPIYTGGADFRIEVPELTYPHTLEVFDPALAESDPESFELNVEVVYAPGGVGADTGEIHIVSNDVRNPHPNSPDRGLFKVDVQANADAPCILVDGRTRNFGQVPIGGTAHDVVTVSNCGSQPLVISSIAVTENRENFTLRLGSWDGNSDGQLDAPVTLGAGNSDTFTLEFTPEQAGVERGKVVIASNDPVQPELELDLQARGSDGVCPVADAMATIRGVSASPRQNVAAVPLQYIVLDGSGSHDPDGTVVSYHWEVLERPQGTIVTLGPTREDPNDTNKARREFRLFTAGTYKIGLHVDDNEGFRSCEQSVVTIQAIPDQKIHIELTWTNPADPDESDQVGSDLDLHFVKMGPGRWFNQPYDIYYLNSNRNGEGIWNPEDPSLDIDVTTGAGPENITMDTAGDCQWYAIGVHYFREMFGTAYATVRIYINAQLVYEQLHTPITRGGQFWDVARVHWNNGQATIFDVNEVYPASLAGQAPEITTDMRSSGLCTEQNLY